MVTLRVHGIRVTALEDESRDVIKVQLQAVEFCDYTS